MKAVAIIALLAAACGAPPGDQTSTDNRSETFSPDPAPGDPGANQCADGIYVFVGEGADRHVVWEPVECNSGWVDTGDDVEATKRDLIDPSPERIQNSEQRMQAK